VSDFRPFELPALGDDVLKPVEALLEPSRAIPNPELLLPFEKRVKLSKFTQKQLERKKVRELRLPKEKKRTGGTRRVHWKRRYEKQRACDLRYKRKKAEQLRMDPYLWWVTNYRREKITVLVTREEWDATIGPLVEDCVTFSVVRNVPGSKVISSVEEVRVYDGFRTNNPSCLLWGGANVNVKSYIDTSLPSGEI
jgi:hypothetical protein